MPRKAERMLRVESLRFEALREVHGAMRTIESRKRDAQPERFSCRSVAHAPPRVVFGALAEKPCLVATHRTVNRSVPRPPLPGEGAGNRTRGRVRYPFFVLRLRRSSSVRPSVVSIAPWTSRKASNLNAQLSTFPSDNRDAHRLTSNHDFEFPHDGRQPRARLSLRLCGR